MKLLAILFGIVGQPFYFCTKIENNMEYMSQEGFDKLNTELTELIKERLPNAIQAISEARDKGDLSENYEYRAAKREQGRVLSRIRFLQRVLEHARVLPADKVEVDCVQLLTKVELVNLNNNKRMEYTIVSPHEANTRERKISVKSPIAQALMNKRKGDIVSVRVPIGMIKLRIDNIGR